jgi:hypothetical protein
VSSTGLREQSVGGVRTNTGVEASGTSSLLGTGDIRAAFPALGRQSI